MQRNLKSRKSCIFFLVLALPSIYQAWICSNDVANLMEAIHCFLAPHTLRRCLTWNGSKVCGQKHTAWLKNVGSTIQKRYPLLQVNRECTRRLTPKFSNSFMGMGK